MKRTITYREITVAIGILVAMVIALTLWVRTPGQKITESGPQLRMGLPVIGLPIHFKESLQDLTELLP